MPSLPTGTSFEQVSDAIDEGESVPALGDHILITEPPTVNVAKGKLWDSKSEFDQEKDRTQFRKYEEACGRVKKFYKEQHGMSSPENFPPVFFISCVEKQTVEFNIQARVNFRKTVRARMGE